MKKNILLNIRINKVFVGFIFFISAVFYLENSYAQWQPTDGPSGGYINLISKLGNRLFVVVNNQKIYCSFDYGANWVSKSNGIENTNISTISGIGEVLLAGTEKGIYQSVDGGNNWHLSNNGISKECNSVMTGQPIQQLYYYKGIFFALTRILNYDKPIYDYYGNYDGSEIKTEGGEIFISKDNGEFWNKVDLKDRLTEFTIIEDTIYMGFEPNINYDENRFLKGSLKKLNYKEIDIKLPEIADKLFDYSMDENALYLFHKGKEYAKSFFTISDASKTEKKVIGIPDTNEFNTIYTIRKNELFYFILTSSKEDEFHKKTHIIWNAKTNKLIPLKNPIKVVGNYNIVSLGKFLFVATEIGVFRSEDDGITWLACNEGIFEADVNSMAEAAQNNNGIISQTVYISDLDSYNSYTKQLHTTYFNGENWSPYLHSNQIEQIIKVGKYNFGLTVDSTIFHREDDIINMKLIAKEYIDGSNSIVRSTNNGNTWEHVKFPVNDSLLVKKLLTDGNAIYAWVSNNKIYQSIDFGTTWIICLNEGLSANILGIEVFNKKLMAITNSGNFLFNNVKNNWTKIENQASSLGNLKIDNLLSFKNYCFLKIDKQIFSSSDSGKTFVPNEIDSVFCLQLIDSTFYAGTEHGLYFYDVYKKKWLMLDSLLFDYKVTALSGDSKNLFLGIIKSQSEYKGINSFCHWQNNKLNVSDLAVLPLKEFIVSIKKNGKTIVAQTTANDYFISSDLGNTWKKLNGLENKQIKNILVFKNQLYAATEDGVFYSINKGNSWQEANIGIHDKDIKYLFSDNEFLYANTPSGIYKSDKFGKNWKNIYCNYPASFDTKYTFINNKLITINSSKPFIHCYDFANEVWEIAYADTFNFKDIVLINNTIYAANEVSGVILSNDFGKTWRKINSGLTNRHILKLIVDNNILFALNTEEIFQFDSLTNKWKKLNSIKSKSQFEITPGSEIPLEIKDENDNVILYKSNKNQSKWQLNEGKLCHFDEKIKDYKIDTNFRSIYFSELYIENEIIVAKSGEKKFFVSSDDGKTWKNTEMENLNGGGNDLIELHQNNVFINDYANNLYLLNDSTHKFEVCLKNVKNVNINKINSSRNLMLAHLRSSGSSKDSIVVSYNKGKEWKNIFNKTNSPLQKDKFKTDVLRIISSVKVQNQIIAINETKETKEIITSYDNGTTWQALNNGINNKSIQDLCKSNDNIILRSNEWISVYPNGYYRNNIYMLNKNTWDSVFSFNSQNFYGSNSRFAVSNNKVYISDFQTIYLSENGGLSWKKFEDNLPGPIKNYFITDSLISVSTTENKNFFSNNGGNEWIKNENNPLNKDCNITKVDEMLFAYQGDSSIVSFNNGVSWKTIFYDKTERLFDFTENFEIKKIKGEIIALLYNDLVAYSIFKFNSVNLKWEIIKMNLKYPIQQLFEFNGKVIAKCIDISSSKDDYGNLNTQTEYYYFLTDKLGNPWRKLELMTRKTTCETVELKDMQLHDSILFINLETNSAEESGNHYYFSQNCGKLWKSVIPTHANINNFVLCGKHILGYNEKKENNYQQNQVKVNEDTLFVFSIQSQSWQSVKINDNPIDIINVSLKNNILFLTSNQGTFISDNEGKNWKKINNNKINTLHNFKTYLLAADDSINYYGILSADNGKNWSKIKLPILFNAISSFESKSNQIYIAGADRLFVSANKGLSWKCLTCSINNANNGITGFDNQLFIFNTIDGVMRSSDNINWEHVNKNLDNFNLRGIVANSEYVFALTFTGELFRLKANSSEWEKLPQTPVNNSSGLFEAIDKVIYISNENGMFCSADNGLTWKAFNELISWPNANLCKVGNTFYAKDYNGNMFTSNDDGKKWTLVVNPYHNQLSFENINLSENKISIQLGDKDEKIAEKIYKIESSDNGKTWQNYSTNYTLPFPLFDKYGYYIINNLKTKSKHYIGIATGENFLFQLFSDDNDKSWHLINNGLPVNGNLFEIIKQKDKFIALTSKGIFISEDGENNWKRQPSFGINFNNIQSIVKNKNRFFALEQYQDYDKENRMGENYYVSEDNAIHWNKINSDSLLKSDSLKLYAYKKNFKNKNTLFVNENAPDEKIIDYDRKTPDLIKGDDAYYIEKVKRSNLIFTNYDYLHNTDIVCSKLFRSNDGGQSWQKTYTPNVTTKLIGFLKNNLYAISDKELIKSKDKGLSWEHIKIDSLNEIKNAKIINNHILVAGINTSSNYKASLYLSDNNGNKWTKKIDLPYNHFDSISFFANRNVIILQEITFNNENNYDYILNEWSSKIKSYSCHHILKSTDFGKTWSHISPFSSDKSAYNFYTLNNTIVATRSDSICTYISEDLKNWKVVSPNFDLNKAILNASNEDKIVVSTPNSIFISNDKGKTYKELENCGILEISTLLLYGNNIIVAGKRLNSDNLDYSIKYSVNNGKEWKELMDGFPISRKFTTINQLLINNNFLYAATAGKSVWKIDLTKYMTK